MKYRKQIIALALMFVIGIGCVGGYLVYNGGTEIEHYDANYNLKAVVKGEGTPVQTGFSRFAYLTDADPLARYTLTEIRVRDVHTLKRK